jgi:hypothetical protein
MRIRQAVSLLALLALGACAHPDTRFPLRPPLTRDGDLRSVWARCHVEPTRHDAHHVSCAPEVYESTLYWDGSDNLVFRPLSQALGLVTSGEAVDVNSLDEVPDSSWFTNRIATLSDWALRHGPCTSRQLLDPDSAAPGSWVIDKGKTSGSTEGFRIVVPGKGRYMIKMESADDQPERMSAAAVVGSRIYYAAGYNATCEQVLWVRPSVFRLLPGLRTKLMFKTEKPFDARALDELIAKSPRRGDRIRVNASAWVSGHAIGPYLSEGTRDDDPNDVVPHEDRRELRGLAVLAAWIGRTDTREDNTFDAWVSDDPSRPDSSPGHVVHYQFDTSEAFGGNWPWAPETLNRRMGFSYVIDWADVGIGLTTLGIPIRPWEDLRPVPGHELFGYWQLDPFVPDRWKNEMPNAAYGRMTERDAAWMARILAHFTPAMLHSLAREAEFTDPSNTKYFEHVLAGRLDRLLARYLTRLSPIANLRVEPPAQLCGVDLAEWRGVRPAESFRYSAEMLGGGGLHVVRGGRGALCVELRHVAPDGGPPDGDASRYVRVTVRDGVAPGALVADLYDLGPRRGFALAAVERPEPR